MSIGLDYGGHPYNGEKYDNRVSSFIGHKFRYVPHIQATAASMGRERKGRGGKWLKQMRARCLYTHYSCAPAKTTTTTMTIFIYVIARRCILHIADTPTSHAPPVRLSERRNQRCAITALIPYSPTVNDGFLSVSIFVRVSVRVCAESTVLCNKHIVLICCVY